MQPQNSQEITAPASLQTWLAEGEGLYNAAVKDFRDLEAQLEGLEAKLIAKQSEVNEIAQVIGKPPIEGNRRLTAQLVTPRMMDRDRESIAIPNSAVPHPARALSNKFSRNP